MSKHGYKPRNNPIPYPIIIAATCGDIEAMNAVLKHYEGYIAVLSKREYIDENGILRVGVDEELRSRLETKLITKTLSFDIS